MATSITDYIKVYNNVLDKNICDKLINIFDNNLNCHERIQNNRKPNFTQFNLTSNHKLSKEIENIHNFLISKVFSYSRDYYEIVGKQFLPVEYDFEEFRIKKYNTGGNDAFDLHVDVLNYATAKRFLSFLFYLNDVSIGGETIFENIIISPKQGNLLIFPPLWLFPHEGTFPISNSKYIMTTYLHYR